MRKREAEKYKLVQYTLYVPPEVAARITRQRQLMDPIPSITSLLLELVLEGLKLREAGIKVSNADDAAKN